MIWELMSAQVPLKVVTLKSSFTYRTRHERSKFSYMNYKLKIYGKYLAYVKYDLPFWCFTLTLRTRYLNRAVFAIEFRRSFLNWGIILVARHVKPPIFSYLINRSLRSSIIIQHSLQILLAGCIVSWFVIAQSAISFVTLVAIVFS